MKERQGEMPPVGEGNAKSDKPSRRQFLGKIGKATFGAAGLAGALKFESMREQGEQKIEKLKHENFSERNKYEETLPPNAKRCIQDIGGSCARDLELDPDRLRELIKKQKESILEIDARANQFLEERSSLFNSLEQKKQKGEPYVQVEEKLDRAEISMDALAETKRNFELKQWFYELLLDGMLDGGLRIEDQRSRGEKTSLIDLKIKPESYYRKKTIS